MLTDSLPAAVESERALLALILQDSTYAAQLTLADSSFYQTEHRLIYKAIQSLSEQRKYIDWSTVTSELKKLAVNQSEVFQVLETLALDYAVTPCAEFLNFHLDEVIEAANKRAALKIIMQLEQDAGEMTSTQISALVQDKFSRLIQPVSHQDLSMGSLMSEVIAQAEFRYEHPGIPGIATGFEQIDNLICGLRPGNMIVLAARPGMGKSALATNIAMNVAKNDIPVVMLSLEMSRTEIGERMMSAHTGIDSYMLKTGRLTSSHFTQMGQAMNELAEMPLTIIGNDSQIRTVPDFQAKLLSFKRKPELAIIDYLQLLNSTLSTDNTVARVSDISRRIKMLAGQLGIPIIALAQLSRKPADRADKKPLLSDLRDSGQIEQDADSVWFIHRPEYFGEDSAKGEAEIIIAKNRHGALGSVEMLWRPQTCQFVDKQLPVIPGY